jgi:hypothetical protein
MRTIKNGIAEKMGIKYTPNSITLKNNSQRGVYDRNYSIPPRYLVEGPPPENWSYAATNSSIASKEPLEFRPIKNDSEEV